MQRRVIRIILDVGMGSLAENYSRLWQRIIQGIKNITTLITEKEMIYTFLG
jgi:hypothetical protein